LLGIKRCQGVSFLELLVVLSIIAILTMMAVPAFTSFLENKRLVATNQNLYYALQLARSEAVKRNTTVYFVMQTGDNWCYGSNSGSTCNCSTAGSCALGSVTTPRAQQTTLSTTGIVSNTIQFEGTRGSIGSSSLVTFTLYGQSINMSVKITALGNLSLCSSTVSGYSACT
jgi:prepilin-type N-terminal cleavage/methylation domain-containing protein